MAAATENPWNATPARVPSAEDLGADKDGAFKLLDVDGEHAPPKDGSMPYADMVNRLLEAAVSACSMAPSVRVTVRFSAGAPQVDSFTAPRTTLRTEDIKLVDNGDGDVTVRVDSTLIPTKRGEPTATVHAGTEPTIKAEEYTASGWRGARVYTKDGGTPTDLKFTVEIH